MGILSDDEARQLAEQWFHDVANAVDVDEACSIYGLLTADEDHLMVGSHLVPLLTATIERYLAGDRSREVCNVVAVSRMIEQQRVVAELEAAKPLPHAINTEAIAMSVVPSVARHMTGDSGLFGIPVPDDAIPRSGTATGLSTGVATIGELTAFYKDYMSTDGWIFDAEFSSMDPDASRRRQLGFTTTAFYAKCTDPVTTVSILVSSTDETSAGLDIVLLIVEISDEDLPRASLTTSPLKAR